MLEKLESLVEFLEEGASPDLWSLLDEPVRPEGEPNRPVPPRPRRRATASTPSAAAPVASPQSSPTATPPWMTNNEEPNAGDARPAPPPLDRALQRYRGTTARSTAASARGRAVSGNTARRDTDPDLGQRLPAARMMSSLNPNALVGFEEGKVIMIEDHSDPDGRMFRIEYRSTTDGQHALAYCLHNPWDGTGRPNAGEAYGVGHVAEDGFLCLGTDSTRSLQCSPYDLERVILRSRYWCTGFSVLKETGAYPNL